jgi:hypothetical protein
VLAVARFPPDGSRCMRGALCFSSTLTKRQISQHLLAGAHDFACVRSFPSAVAPTFVRFPLKSGFNVSLSSTLACGCI